MPRRPPASTVRLPVTDTLDLHHFKPAEVPSLLREYLDECHRLGIGEVRIIHGKGKGVLMRTVHGILARHPAVLAFGPATDRSGWGATIARLRPNEASASGSQPRPAPASWWQRVLALLK